ncbi:helix-turn-helix domain-containing protein [bacterium]|nr:helix-turn-helix domain-containing protein [bacterium]
MEQLLTVNQIAEYLQVSPRTVREWVSIGFVPHYKISRNVRFRMSELELWVKKKQKKGRYQYKISIEV